MIRIPIGIIIGFCLVPLLVVSCGSSHDTGSSAPADPDEIMVPDSLPDPTTASGVEFLKASHILITWSPIEDNLSQTEEDALNQIQNIQDEILTGQATFEEMAFNYSHCTSAADSGRLPDFTSGAITEELDSTLFALEPGEISGIIRTRFGFHLVKRLES